MNNNVNKEFFQSNQYLLSDYFNGTPKVNPITIKKIANSTYELNNRLEVEVISTVTKLNKNTKQAEQVTITTPGFISSSLISYKDDLDIILSEIATLLNIKASNVYRLLTPTSYTGTLSLNTKEDNEQILTISSLLNEFNRNLKYSQNQEPDYLKSYKSYHFTEENPLSDLDLIKKIIDLPLLLISDALNPSVYDLTKITTDYIKMLFFNYITNQSDTSLASYSVLINSATKKVRLSPIYDYNNSLENTKTINLNNQIISKEAFLECLYTYYYPEYKALSRGLAENLSAYKTSMEMIINHITTEEYAPIIKKFLFTNLDTIAKYELDVTNGFNESKIDMVLTQTSINLNAVNQNTLIRNKYQTINPPKKNLTTLIPEQLKPKPKQPPKFLSTLIFILILLAVIGLGIVIAYFIFNLAFLEI